MKYSLFFTCLIYVLLVGTEVTGLSIFPKKSSLSLLGSPKITTTKKPSQKATTGLLPSLTGLLGLGGTTTTPVPTTAQPISKIISDMKSIQNKLNELRQSESPDVEKLDSATTETPHAILSDVPKVPSTSTDVLLKGISLESPQAGSINQPVSNLEVDQMPKSNDLLNDSKTMPMISNVSDEVPKIIGLILNSDLVSSSVGEAESKYSVEKDPLQPVKEAEDKLELSSCLPSLQEQDVHFIPEGVSQLPDFSKSVDTDSRAPAVESTDGLLPEVNSVTSTPVAPDSSLSEVLESESTNPFQTTFNPLIIAETDVNSIPQNVSDFNPKNNVLPCQENSSTIQSTSDPTENERESVKTSEVDNLLNVNNILPPSASSDSFVSDLRSQEILSNAPSVLLNVLPLEHIRQPDEISKVVFDVPVAVHVDVTNSDVETTISPQTPELTTPTSSPGPVSNYFVSTEPSKESSPKVSVSLPETSTVSVSSSILSALVTAIPSIPGLGDLVTYVVSVLSALLATISDRIGISLENLIAQMSTLLPLVESLINMPGVSPEILSTGQSLELLSRFELSGIGGLTELLNFTYSFLYNLLRSVPDLLKGIPLATVLKVLPNFVGTFENILPNLSVGNSRTLYQTVPADLLSLADSETENSISEFDNLFNSRDVPLIDIHHNEFNLLKIVIA